jgi:TonB family protein
MVRQMQASIIISIILHCIALIIFAGVKLYTDIKIEDTVSVTFVEAQRERPMRRSIPTRPMTSVSNSTQKNLPDQYTIRPEYNTSIDFYYEPSDQKFSRVKNLGHDLFYDYNIQDPVTKPQQKLIAPVSMVEKPHLQTVQIQPKIYEGRDLLEDMEQIKPDMKMDKNDEILRRFFRAVRKKIESEKKYPIAAQKAGIEGNASVRMTILKDGQLEEAEILESSGYDILDKAALRSVQNADPFPPIPEAANLDKIDIEIKLVFKITRNT